MTITQTMIEAAYDVAQRAYEPAIALQKNAGVALLVRNHGMNESTARTYIRVFEHLREGKKFNRTLSAQSFTYFLDHIYQDYGSTGLATALESLRMHINYFEEIEDVRMGKVRDIYESYFTSIPTFSTDEKEQGELTSYYQEHSSREAIISDLTNLKSTDPVIIEFHGKRYKRDNKTVAQIKLLRNFQCQLCNTVILKKNGEKYIEAAHIHAKRQKGPESPSNILIVCPNHHKEFDFGNLEILTKDDNHISFLLNDQPYTISLEFV